MTSAAVADAPTPLPDDLRELCELVAGREMVPVADLLASGRDVTLLAKALAKGLMVIGRQSYTETLFDAKPEIVAGKQVVDPETGHLKMNKTWKVNLEQGWSWTGLPPGRKSLSELLKEEATLHRDAPKLHIKITTEGIAAL